MPAVGEMRQLRRRRGRGRTRQGGPQRRWCSASMVVRNTAGPSQRRQCLQRRDVRGEAVVGGRWGDDRGARRAEAEVDERWRLS